ncbi:hypothetical protein TBLA_0B05020 [Henningerozyma blattae CBS 6284]|uniref:Amino acid transporter transmembrane domain-containing protein n=1 Tax=Henningerozyma blattae (strain ATCC 34711 / CBS 6284 / DSM 70876 / NBRC 10599 / NRRL Y-10934 / UCD 77-7) TaxID=1071380 RepID=I2GYY5_HENB6|nr:hypothetical protein TBLA_0B05020 [Tetrapisispora blattae CBS 6284]CCH59337.1 hypothetical protein TBLA_0B05020 [Tetrapisispora blattae CBS 6284]
MWNLLSRQNSISSQENFHDPNQNVTSILYQENGDLEQNSDSEKKNYNIIDGSLEKNSVEVHDAEKSGDQYDISSVSSTKDESIVNYKTCSWQHTAGLMLSEYIVLAIMSFPWSFSILGLVPGLILTVFVAICVLYTGLIISEFCEKHPQLMNVCDIGQYLFGGYRSVWYATAICFLGNNILIQGLHVLVGAKYLNTITDHSQCSVVFSVIIVIISLIFSLPRKFSSMSILGYFSAGTMFIGVVLAMIFSGIQSHPYKYNGTPVKYTLFPEKGTTYVDAMCACLNIVYSFVGQITYPQFISEMRNPKEFRKVLWLVTACEVIVFSLAGSIIYVYVGNQYMTAPAFGSLERTYKIIAFTFAVPTMVFAGALYSNVSAKLVFFTIFQNKNEKMLQFKTASSWIYWSLLVLLTWILAFIIAEVIPFFSDLVSLLSALFDCWFGFIFWGVAYIRLKHEKYNFSKGERNFQRLTFTEKLNFITCVLLIIVGLYILGPGLYASVQSIIINYEKDAYGVIFSCKSNGI